MFSVAESVTRVGKNTTGFHTLEDGDLNTIIREVSRIVKENYRGNHLFTHDIIEQLNSEIFNSLKVEFLEYEAIIDVPQLEPHKVFSDLNIMAVDGASVVFKGHPIRLVVARSGVFSHSQRLTNVLRLNNTPKSTLRIVDAYGEFLDIDDLIRKVESETLAYIESETIIELVDKLDVDDIDYVFHDGPLYFPNGFEYTYDMVKFLYEKGVPIISIVKNSYSRTIMEMLGNPRYLDSDFFSFFLKPGTRSPFFVNENPKQEVKESELKNVSSYYMTPNGALIRIDVPYWVFEDYGATKIIEIVASDISLGNGKHSYLLKKADRIAKFTEYEKKKLLRELEFILSSAGFNEQSFYNHKRWGLYATRKRGL